MKAFLKFETNLYYPGYITHEDLSTPKKTDDNKITLAINCNFSNIEENVAIDSVINYKNSF